MSNKICKNCIYWKSPHYGMVFEYLWGSCSKLRQPEANGVTALCEGCIDVRDRVDDVEYLSGANFGCINFKKKLK